MRILAGNRFSRKNSCTMRAEFRFVTNSGKTTGADRVQVSFMQREICLAIATTVRPFFTKLSESWDALQSGACLEQKEYVVRVKLDV